MLGVIRNFCEKCKWWARREGGREGFCTEHFVLTKAEDWCEKWEQSLEIVGKELKEVGEIVRKDRPD